jgi:hypothetical protein
MSTYIIRITLPRGLCYWQRACAVGEKYIKDLRNYGRDLDFDGITKLK